MKLNFEGPAVNQILQEDSGDVATLVPFSNRVPASRLMKLKKKDSPVFGTLLFFPHSAFL